MKHKLTAEEADILAVLMTSPAYKLLDKVFAMIDAAHVDKVMAVDVLANQDRLIVEKAKNDGIKWFLKEVQAFKKTIVKQDK